MKKNFFILIAMAAIMSIFVSCGNNNMINGWYTDYDSALKAAKSGNRTILLLLSSDTDLEVTAKALDALVKKDNTFSKAVKKDFVCLFFDFTNIKDRLSSLDENASEKEKKAYEKDKKLLDRKFFIADHFLCGNETPCARLISSDGYYIADVNFDYASENADAYVQILKSYETEIKYRNDLIAATKKGSALEKVAAFDALYESLPESNRIGETQIHKAILSLDKKNESGLVEKYLAESINAEAYSCIMKLDIDGAVSVYEKRVEDERLSAETKQELLCYAATIAMHSNTVQFDKVIGLYQKAFDVAPESSLAPKIQETIAAINKAKEEYTAQLSSSAEGK